MAAMISWVSFQIIGGFLITVLGLVGSAGGVGGADGEGGEERGKVGVGWGVFTLGLFSIVSGIRDILIGSWLECQCCFLDIMRLDKFVTIVSVLSEIQIRI